eukprot:TRINITY_DN21760_c0_g2_i1.p1 TRINITY_DN21760_c0_g2~~TRINITY_DN21760_c0_g2_i1.p1  ORF type:complete len:787 (+),score=116.10 TRINITY_DN21760_c0_g2_i1:69-2429(+)
MGAEHSYMSNIPHDHPHYQHHHGAGGGIYKASEGASNGGTSNGYSGNSSSSTGSYYEHYSKQYGNYAGSEYDPGHNYGNYAGSNYDSVHTYWPSDTISGRAPPPAKMSSAKVEDPGIGEVLNLITCHSLGKPGAKKPWACAEPGMPDSETWRMFAGRSQLDHIYYDVIAAGHKHTILIQSDGKALAVGADSGQDPGPRRESQKDIPEPPPGVEYIAAAGGARHTVLVRSDGEAVAVGSNLHGQCVIPPLTRNAHYCGCAAGYAHTVLLSTDGQVRAFGTNAGGQCSVPAQTWNGVYYTQVAAGDQHTVLLRSDGVVETYGSNHCGQCIVPPLPEGTHWTFAAAGVNHTVLIRSDGWAIAFGENAYHQCAVPHLPTGVHYAAVACGATHTVLLTNDGQALACGYRGDSRCEIPALPVGLKYVSVAAGHNHTVLLRSDGMAMAFGNEMEPDNRTSVPSWGMDISEKIVRFKDQMTSLNTIYEKTARSLARRSISLGDLLHFYHEIVKHKLPRVEQATTRDIVRDTILPRTELSRKSWADHLAMESDHRFPVTYVVHAWDGRFLELLGAVLHHASSGKYCAPAESLTDSEKRYRQWLRKRYWIDIFCVNQHLGICKDYRCNCAAPTLSQWHAQCETNKFEEVLQLLRDHRNCSVVLALDRPLTALRRTWCLQEVHCALGSGIDVKAAFGQQLPDAASLRNFRSQVAQSQATHAADRERILATIQKTSVDDIRLCDNKITDFIKMTVADTCADAQIASKSWFASGDRKVEATPTTTTATATVMATPHRRF